MILLTEFNKVHLTLLSLQKVQCIVLIKSFFAARHKMSDQIFMQPPALRCNKDFHSIFEIFHLIEENRAKDFYMIFLSVFLVLFELKSNSTMFIRQGSSTEI